MPGGAVSCGGAVVREAVEGAAFGCTIVEVGSSVGAGFSVPTEGVQAQARISQRDHCHIRITLF